MSSITRAPATPVVRFLQDRISPLAVFAYQVLVLAAFVAVLIFGISWVQRPFIGAFVEHTLLVNTVGPVRPGSWALHREGISSGYRLVAMDGRPLRNQAEFRQRIEERRIGEEVELSLLSQGKRPEVFTVRLQAFPITDLIAYLVIPYGIGILFLASSFYIFSLRKNDATGRAYALFTASTAFCVAGLFDLYTTNYLTGLWVLSLAVSGGALFNLALLLPSEQRFIEKYPFLRWIGYLPAALVLILALPTVYDVTRPYAYLTAWRIEIAFAAISFMFFFGWMAVRRVKSSSPVEREQSRLILWGSGLAYLPLVGWSIAKLFMPELRFSVYLLLPLALFPLVTAYAILRYRLLRTDYLLSRSLVYGGLTVAVASGYALLVSGLGLLVDGVFSPMNPVLVGAFVFGLALVLNPVRLRLQRLVDQTFFRSQSAYRNRLDEFSHELTKAIELADILSRLRTYVTRDLNAEPLHIFIHDPLGNLYKAVEDESGRQTSDIQFPSGSALVRTLDRKQGFIILERPDQFPTSLQPDKVRLSLLDSQLFIPLSGQHQLLGWLALGPRKSGEPYQSSALRFLSALCDQAALAIERARVVADLERRVREMNVLTRIAQGTNFTLHFDDILELIFTQTNQVIPTRDFRVILKNETGGFLQYVFYLRNDERLSEHENLPLEPANSLEAEVINRQRALIASDYGREARNRGFAVEAEGIYAWMGVPLNNGTETIGMMSLGSRDPLIVYREEQLDLFQAIADQAAGAIVKARLLDETEQRARQLATLNEIGRGLTSTLEINPLLNNILKSATMILNCAAGSLFLVDVQTGELIFEVVIGPVAADLVGKRLPPGTGVVGEAVESRQAIIANDAKRRKDWFEKTDEQTGFSTQDLLVVPMMVKDRVIGVIEVINKNDGSPFNQADQELLTTFASQATIAIENARLYTMTDQALAARVEELSVMQRIDRELNASLDVGRAMRITLEWAMRQSRANAGLVGIVEDEGIRIMTAQGYPEELIAGKRSSHHNGSRADMTLSLDLPAIRKAIDTGQPVCIQLGAPGSEAGGSAAEGMSGLLDDASVQVGIPIRRETESIGVILLENVEPEMVSEEVLAFLSRLSDHAAIAIANAQLYSEVEAANQAKSKFVSFVAHELKNPMASIKGYTELVAGGMAGPVNEMQSSFLATIRSNVDRMNTIVSDLNDLTKIQVGSLRLEFTSVSVHETVQEVVRSLSRQIEQKEQILDVQLPDELPPVWGDPLRLSQVLTNLISNANKYTPTGGIITLGGERSLDGQGPAALEVIEIWVRDNGIGIPEEDQDKIFQQYFRTELSKETASGTGLGLNISKSLIEMQGGRIWFESQEGKGTVFHITIPVAESE